MLQTFLEQLQEMRLEPFRNAAIAGLPLVLVAWFLLRRATDDPSRAAPVVCALAVAGAYVAAYYGMNGTLPRVPPTSAKHWVAAFVVSALVLAPIRPAAVRGLLWSALSAGFLALALQSLRTNRWEGREEAYWLGGFFVVGFLHWLATTDLLEGERESRAPGLLAVLLGAGILAQVLGQSTGESAHVLGAISIVPVLWLVSLWPGPPAASGGAGPWCAATFGLAVLGVAYAETPPVAAGVALLAPQLVRIPGGNGWRANLVRLVLIAGAGAFAISRAWVEPDPYMDY
ncbi:MAG: hypothetical protein GY711_00405 [bacterium]|nr:hypothetical protein [bacterium]